MVGRIAVDLLCEGVSHRLGVVVTAGLLHADGAGHVLEATETGHLCVSESGHHIEASEVMRGDQSVRLVEAVEADPPHVGVSGHRGAGAGLLYEGESIRHDVGVGLLLEGEKSHRNELVEVVLLREDGCSRHVEVTRAGLLPGGASLHHEGLLGAGLLHEDESSRHDVGAGLLHEGENSRLHWSVVDEHQTGGHDLSHR
ncbi:hypothetical protein ACN47E_007419 [Coniothyrium glycines]